MNAKAGVIVKALNKPARAEDLWSAEKYVKEHIKEVGR